MAQLGRIGGHLLAPNLERRGVDLAFKDSVFDSDPILYLQVDPNIRETVNAGDIEPGKIYQINDPGTTNFILVGAPDNNPGTIFSPITAAFGDGTVYELNDDVDASPFSGSGAKVGIKTDTPVYDLDIISDVKTTNAAIGSIGYIGNVTLSSTNTFGTVSGPLYITPDQSSPLVTADQFISDNLKINDNTISSFDNSDITLDTNQSGKVLFNSNVTINGDYTGAGNITLDGNLSAAENITVGDSPLDRVTIGTDFTQTLEPASDTQYDIGAPDKRWANFWSDNWQDPDTLTITGMIVSDQVRIDGTETGGEIFTLQSNDNLNLLPDTGIVYIEDTIWEGNDITNTLNTPLTFTSAGIGYLRLMGSNGFVIPAGGDAARPSSPEVGDTRWNTDGELLECFDAVTGTYITSIGPGDVIDQNTMEELGNIYSLILG